MTLQRLFDDKRIRLTAAQGRAAQFILDHGEETVFLTASELAARSGVSEATLVRLARSLGYAGYPGLQRALRDEFRNRLSTVARLGKTARGDRRAGDTLTRIVEEDIENLSRTLGGVPPEAFRKAVEDMHRARRIYVVGLHGAHGPAVTLTLYLTYLKREAHAVAPRFGDAWSGLHVIGAGDLTVGISLPRYTRLTSEILDVARRQGSMVGAITDSPLSPIARRADWVLPVHSRLDSFIESFTPVVSLINALLTALSLLEPRKTLETLEERERLWKEKEIHLPPFSDRRRVRRNKGTRGG